MKRLFSISIAVVVALFALAGVSTAVNAPRWVAARYVEAQRMVGLRWMPVPGATAYAVLRSETSGSGYAAIARTSQPQHFDKAVQPGMTYYYVLQAVAGVEVSASSAEKSVSVAGMKKKVLDPPKKSSVKASSRAEFGKSTSKVGLDWPEVPGAVAYNVYRTRTPGKDYELVSSTSDSSSVDTAVESGETYHYVVTALDDSFQETPHSEETSVAVAGRKAAKAKKSRADSAGGDSSPGGPLPSAPAGKKVARSPRASSESAPRRVTRPAPRPVSPGVKAGWSDDNRQFNYYLNYLQRFKHVRSHKVDVSGRVVFSVHDDYGRPLSGVTLRIRDRDGRILAERRTYADGRAMFFTTEEPWWSRQLAVDAVYQDPGISTPFSRFGRRQIDIRFPVLRETSAQVPLDVLFLLDTTGSMSDEISRLKSTMEVINYQIGELPTSPDVRFGMVEYRDRGDAYLTRVTPFMSDVDSFRARLRAVRADGGGDTPEDLQEGLQEAMYGVEWRDEAVKVVFLVADAPPHLDYQDETYTYVDAMRDAAGKGIKIVTIGASGLDEGGEYIFRQLAQYTMGEFVFLTYGERGESGPGTPARVSHHTGSNYQVRSLDSIIVNIVRKELSHFGRQGYTAEKEYFETVADESLADESEGILGELLDRGLKQLLDYSSVWVETATPAALMPVAVADGVTRRKAEVLGDQLLVKLFGFKRFKLVERRDLRKVLEEKNITAMEGFDAEQAARIGSLLGARVMILPRLSRGPEKLELLVRMVRVETGEILSVSLMKLDSWLI